MLLMRLFKQSDRNKTKRIAKPAWLNMPRGFKEKSEPKRIHAESRVNAFFVCVRPGAQGGIDE